MEKTLEHEFQEFKMLHIVAILKAKMIEYYETIQQGQINLPDFMRDDTPEKLADRDIENLYNTDLQKFMNLYEVAYQDLACRGEF